MKLKTLLIGCFGGFIMLNSCTESPSVKDYSAYVNPFIGTGGHGHTFPGAVVPHGMIQPSPDTRIDGWDACSGYYYDDNTINGFSHTHVSGTGCCDYGDVLLMPTVGKPQYLPRHLSGKSGDHGYQARRHPPLHFPRKHRIRIYHRPGLQPATADQLRDGNRSNQRHGNLRTQEDDLLGFRPVY